MTEFWIYVRNENNMRPVERRYENDDYTAEDYKHNTDPEYLRGLKKPGERCVSIVCMDHKTLNITTANITEI